LAKLEIIHAFPNIIKDLKAEGVSMAKLVGHWLVVLKVCASNLGTGKKNNCFLSHVIF
jgi:hypothetical protein